MNINKKLKELEKSVDSLNALVKELEAENYYVSYFHHKGELGRFTNCKSDVITLASVSKYDVLYDAKTKLQTGTVDEPKQSQS